MARPLRIEFEGALYHVTSRGNACGDIFLDDRDRRRFLGLMGEVCEQTGWQCYAYCLMTNHYHLLIQTPRANLAAGMRQLNGRYSQAFNRSHERVGHVLQGRYFAIHVDREAHLLEVCRYVVLNPVRAALVTSPADWPWSSYRATIRAAPAPPWLAVEATLAGFGSNAASAIERYRAFVAAGRDVPRLSSSVTQQVFLGSAAFVDQLRTRIGDSRDLSQVPRAQVARPLDWYASQFPHRDLAMARANLSGDHSQADIARHFGVHRSTVSRAISAARSAAK
jgi:REP element-mobilizing transposase RayT